MTTVDHRTRAENVRFLADTGECATGAAQRMGLTVDALEKWARGHDPAAWSRLVENERGVGKVRRGRVLA
jgi:hypothetical protein